ncbi:MAG: DJ-1/PfpI family protein [Candidatus Riflemargulisbacteria bacterium]
MKRIAIVIAFNGFRDEEFFVPYNDLSNGFDVQVFSTQIGEANGKLGGIFLVSHTIQDIEVDKFDALMLIGGPGGYTYLGNLILQDIINKFYSLKKLVSAICMAPLILAEAGIMNGKRATVFIGDKDRFISKGVVYTGRDVEMDGNIITADGAGSSEFFSNKVREYLHG